MKRYIFIVLMLFVLSGCEEKETEEPVQEVYAVPDEPAAVGSLTFSERIPLSYARSFSMDRYEGGYLLLTLPGQRRILAVPEDKEIPGDLPSDVIALKQPVDHVYLVASAAADMVASVGGVDAVSFCGLEAEDWYVPAMKDAMENGDILYAGKYRAPDYEMLVSGGCRLAIENTMIAHTPEVMDKLEELGIPVVIDYSSYESSPLGRMEWVKFYGALTGHLEEAEKVFEMQCEKATGLAETGKTVAFFYIRDDGAVVVRSGDDYVPEMIRMAGGSYIPENADSGSKLGSAPMQMEAFYAVAKDADYLVYNTSIVGEIQSVDDLIGRSELMADFTAVKEGRVYVASSNMYQQTMSLGAVIEDLHKMMTGEADASLEILRHLE